MSNTLNIQITVNDEQMTQLIKGNLEKLPDEKIQEILSNALTEFFKTQNGQQLFYDRSSYGYNSVKPTNLLNSMISNAVSKDLLKPHVDDFISKLENNFTGIIEKCILHTFTNLFFTSMEKDEFENRIYRNINNMLDNRR